MDLRSSRVFLMAAAVTGLGWAALAGAQEPEGPAPNSPEEPLAKEFSPERARAFLDAVSLQWQKERKCLTCHTNAAYLSTGAGYGSQRAAFGEVRKFAEELVRDRWESKGPRGDWETVIAAQALAASDAEMGGKLHPLTRKALDRMWIVQRPDGAWNWAKCNWPPMESDDHYGATAALLAVGRAPENYASTPAAQEGLRKVRAYLAKNPPATIHHKAMLAWASTYVEGIMTEADRKKTLEEMLALQRPDGGWSAGSLGDWKRSDGEEQDTKTSDGYGTGFVLYQARLAGVAASDERLRKGVDWLKTHQRESGRWFTRSLNKDNKHFLTHAGTAYALLALHACGETGAEGKSR